MDKVKTAREIWIEHIEGLRKANELAELAAERQKEINKKLDEINPQRARDLSLTLTVRTE